ncbi:MAG: RloB domain-containing protein [Prosthecobacter sp.]|nr:RloB domain-containing protein [Prosthecobacter sp.]
MPPPRRQLQVRRTVLIVVEGDTEFAFCRYLKAVGSHGRNIQITIKNAHGGSPDKIVEFARRQARQSAFEQVVIVFDDDKPLTATGEKMAKAMRAQVFRFQPCIEGFFFQLMGRPMSGDSATCKRAFHQQGLDEKQKVDHDAYAKLFPSAQFNLLMTNSQFAALWKLFTNAAP